VIAVCLRDGGLAIDLDSLAESSSDRSEVQRMTELATIPAIRIPPAYDLERRKGARSIVLCCSDLNDDFLSFFITRPARLLPCECVLRICENNQRYLFIGNGLAVCLSIKRTRSFVCSNAISSIKKLSSRSDLYFQVRACLLNCLLNY